MVPNIIGTPLELMLLTPITCQKCGRVWTPRVESPEKCPSCRTHDWDKPRRGLGSDASTLPPRTTPSGL